jgi:membrane-bound lytic murein transglycosylase D
MPSSAPARGELEAQAAEIAKPGSALPARQEAANEGDPADPDIAKLEELQEAEKAYEKAIELYQAGNPLEGRGYLKQAFAILATAIEDDKLPVELHTDFLSMLEKARTWEPGPDDESSVEDSSLEAAAIELETTEATTKALPRPKVRKHVIKVNPDNELTKKYIRLYTGKRSKATEQALARSGRYRDMIHKALRKEGVPPEMFWLVMTESEYKVHAVSRSGAGGLWQFMPFTARRYGLEVSYWVDERFLPEKATIAALRYLKDLYQWFGDWHLAMAAYNRGENGIGRDLQFSRSTDFGTLSKRRALPRETHNYVPKWMAGVLIGENPKAYGLNVVYEKPEPYDTVTLPKALDLNIAAKAAGVQRKDIQRLNPHVRAWCTPKNSANFKFRIPVGSKSQFLAYLANVKDWNPGPELVRYKVRRGDFLGKIARRYRTSVRSIMRLNRIRNPRHLRVGQKLKIKPGKSFYRKTKSRKARTPAKVSKQPDGTLRYQVRNGDSLGSIAAKYKTTVKRLVALNKIADAKLIRPGMVLKIHPGK